MTLCWMAAWLSFSVAQLQVVQVGTAKHLSKPTANWRRFLVNRSNSGKKNWAFSSFDLHGLESETSWKVILGKLDQRKLRIVFMAQVRSRTQSFFITDGTVKIICLIKLSQNCHWNRGGYAFILEHNIHGAMNWFRKLASTSSVH
jgi:hypothetical protein